MGCYCRQPERILLHVHNFIIYNKQMTYAYTVIAPLSPQGAQKKRKWGALIRNKISIKSNLYDRQTLCA